MSVYLTPEQLDQVKACAARRGVSVNEFVRSVLLDHIASEPRPASRGRVSTRGPMASKDSMSEDSAALTASMKARQERRRLATPGEPPRVWRPPGQSSPPNRGRLMRFDDQGDPITAPLAAKAWRVYEQVTWAGELERVPAPDGEGCLDLDPQVPDEWLFLALGPRRAAYRLFAVNDNGQRLPVKAWLVVIGGGTLSDVVRSR